MPFTPTPELEHKLLCDLSDEQRTVSDVAGSNGIPLAEFITWLASDRTQQRITEIERAFTARIRLTALGNLNFALRAAVDTISTQQKDHLAREPFSLAERRERRHLQESARRAGNFIYRLAKLPLPEGGGGGKGDEALTQLQHTSVPPESGESAEGDEAPAQPPPTSVPKSPATHQPHKAPITAPVRLKPCASCRVPTSSSTNPSLRNTTPEPSGGTARFLSNAPKPAPRARSKFQPISTAPA